MKKKTYNLLIFLLIIFPTIIIAQVSKNVDVLGNWDDKTIPPIGSDPQRLNEVWGFAVDGKEYGVIGSTLGIHIIDVTDPKNPKLQDYIKGSSSGKHVVHRDFHDYGGYLYMVADEGASKLQIADITKLPTTGKAEVVYESDELLIRSHNIFIDSSSKKLYACGVADNGGKSDLEIYSLEDPKKPRHLTSYQNAYVHDIYVRGDTAFLNCGGKGMFVVDFNDTQNPKLLGSLESYPDKGYNHSGWTTEDFKYYFLADETAGMKIKTIDISDFADLKAINTFGSEVHPKSMVHNLIVKGDFLYTSYYHDGFYVFNINDPKNPTIVGFYDTYLPDTHSGFYGAWGVYPFLPSGNILLSDMNSGLWVFDVSKITVGLEEVNKSSYVKSYFIDYNKENQKIRILNKTSFGEKIIIDIISTSGQTIKSTIANIKGFGKLYLDSHFLSSGAYLIRIKNKNKVEVAKVFVY